MEAGSAGATLSDATRARAAQERSAPRPGQREQDRPPPARAAAPPKRSPISRASGRARHRAQHAAGADQLVEPLGLGDRVELAQDQPELEPRSACPRARSRRRARAAPAGCVHDARAQKANVTPRQNSSRSGQAPPPEQPPQAACPGAARARPRPPPSPGRPRAAARAGRRARNSASRAVSSSVWPARIPNRAGRRRWRRAAPRAGRR